MLFAGKAVPGSPWFLVAKVDAAEVYAPLHNRAIISALLSLLLFTAFIMLLGVIWRQRKAEFLRIEMREQARAAGKLPREKKSGCNPCLDRRRGDCHGHGGAGNPDECRGGKATGPRGGRRSGRPLDEDICHHQSGTRRPVENPVQKVLETGGIIGLSNHTALIARDGSELPIADRGAPIKDRDGIILGVVLVFNDQEEKEKGAEDHNCQGSLSHSVRCGTRHVLVLDRSAESSTATGMAYYMIRPRHRERSAHCHEVLHKGPGVSCDSCQTRQVLQLAAGHAAQDDSPRSGGI